MAFASIKLGPIAITFIIISIILSIILGAVLCDLKKKYFHKHPIGNYVKL